MKRILVAIAAFAAATAVQAQGQADPSQARQEGQLTAEQQKTQDCRRSASQRKLKGKERDTFMNRCLGGAKVGFGNAAVGGKGAKPAAHPQKKEKQTTRTTRGLGGAEVPK